MAKVSFSQFRTGTPLPLAAGGQVSYTELKKSGLPDFYIRIVHELALGGKLTREQVSSIVSRAASPDRRKQQEARNELEALRPAPALVAPPPPARPSGARPAPKRAEKGFELVSSGDHKQAVRLAEAYGLRPVQVPERSLRPGQSPDAHTVRALEAVASKLITSGSWKTV